MKRFYSFLLVSVISIGAFAQMQVWSNGTIIFSHDQSSVDSISFGSPMHVQTHQQSLAAESSLAGSVYVSGLSGSSQQNDLYTLCFLDGTNGYYTYNESGNPYQTSNRMIAFTYSVSGTDITITVGENSYRISPTVQGKLIGRNAIVLANWYNYNNITSYPATFLNYNR